MTEKEIKFISLLRSLDEEKLERFCEILLQMTAEDDDSEASSKE